MSHHKIPRWQRFLIYVRTFIKTLLQSVQMASLYTSAVDLRTGSIRRRKVRTTEAVAVFNILSVQRLLIGDRPTKHLKALEKLTIYIHPATEQISLFEQAQSLPVRMVVHEQHRGQRLFWVCPQSSQQASLLYLVQTDTGPLLGSCKGLGLSYPSQALHRTPAYDSGVYTGTLKPNLAVYLRASSRRQRRQVRGLMRLSWELEWQLTQ